MSRQLEIMRHSLGLKDDGTGESYRNYYVAGGEAEAVCLELVADGLMYEGRASAWSCGRVFHVSDKGKLAATEEPR